MTGLKYKLAHKRAGRDSWSTSERAQRQHLVKILQEMIDDLSSEPKVIEPPAAVPTTAKSRQGLDHKRRRRTVLAARRATRQGKARRTSLVVSGGRRRR